MRQIFHYLSFFSEKEVSIIKNNTFQECIWRTKMLFVSKNTRPERIQIEGHIP